MAVVRRLPNDLANQIAAGEVVERPASVVKELVENALDAGATKVTVEIETGGVARIRVTDDGSGMDEADARLALERHATSKIAVLEDLARITSFGFRGEALPSIASVSRFTLSTRVRGADAGLALTVVGGGETSARPVGCAVGTQVEVADLFFNVPARRKFLKATSTESGHVGEVVLLAALGSPRVAFTLSRDGKVAREITRATSRQERVHQVVSESRLEACERERGPMRVEAYLAPPERARAGAVALYVFVNGRPVKDRLLTRAVAQAYGSVLEPGRYPVGVVYLSLPPELVDVNVHPQKAEVRFADARGILDALTRELHAALAHAFALPAFATGHSWWKPGGAASVIPERVPIPEPAHVSPVPTDASADPWQLRPAAPAPSYDSYVVPDPGHARIADRIVAPSDGPSDALFGRAGFYGQLRFVGQVRAMFLLAEGPDGLYVLDQHAAAERVTFERLRADYRGRRIASQRLLIPEVVILTPSEHALLEEHADDALGLGLEVRLLSGSSVAVHGVPKVLVRAHPEHLVRDLVAEVGRAAKRPFNDAVDLVLATMACHGSVRAGDVLSEAEAKALLVALDAAEFAGHCPHGRPVVMRLGWASWSDALDADVAEGEIDRLARLAGEGLLVAVVGPTASGKTDLATRLAERVSGEVISADSVQVYRGFDLGSGKPTREELARARHHLIDVLDPGDDIDAARYAGLASAAIDDVRARGKVPIVCGGTFLWVKALLFGLADAPSADAQIRARHQAIVDEQGRAELHRLLGAVDPASAARLHPNDVVRVGRALEVFELTGETLSALHEAHAFRARRYEARLVARRVSPEALTLRIARRVEGWLAAGWIDEVRARIDEGHGETRAMGSVGYREVRAHLRGELSRDALEDSIVRATRVFARRQRTWLGSAEVTWLE